MNWNSSARKKRFNRGWEKIRLKVLKRDGYRCQHVRADTGKICGAPANEVDHIHSSIGHRHDDDRLSNLQALCHYHHAQKTHAESVRSRVRNTERRRRAAWYDGPCFK